MEYHSVPCFEWSFERVGSRALDGIPYIDLSLGIEVFVEISRVIHYICSGGVEYRPISQEATIILTLEIVFELGDSIIASAQCSVGPLKTPKLL